jgi:hypothetical protein
MKITSAEVIVCSPGRNFVTHKLYTDEGVYGLGVDIDEKAAKKYPYKRACLPVNRKEDGTMFNW